MKKLSFFAIMITLLCSSIMLISPLAVRTSNNIISNESYSQTNFKISRNAGIAGVTIPSPPPPPSGKTPHAVFSILNDTALANQATSGAGTNGNPYVISGYSVSVSAVRLFDIENVDKIAIIENCYFNGQGNTGGTGLYIKNVTNVYFENNYIENIQDGAQILGGTNIYFLNTIIVPLASGIYANPTTNSQITGNQIYGGTNTAIADLSSDGTNISYNQVYSPGNIGVDSYSSTNITIESNIVLNSILCIEAYKDDHVFIYNNSVISYTSAGVDIETSNFITVFYNQINDSWHGINVMYANNNNISNNLIYNSTIYGVYLNTANNNFVDNNNIIGITASYGIFLTASNYNTISQNTINKASILFEIDSSIWNIASHNTFLNIIGNGTVISNSQYTIISNSFFASASNYALVLSGGANNRVNGNNFTDANYYDLILQRENNTAVEKNIFSALSHLGGSQALDTGVNNLFIYNYWAGWTSPDADNDGIVDNSYSIDGPAHTFDTKPIASISYLNILGTTLSITSSSSSSTLSTSTNTSTSLPKTSSLGIPDLQSLVLFTGLGLVVGLVVPVAIRRIKK